jgi:hypothetical protein
MEEFRGSKEFLTLEAAAVSAEGILPRGDGKLEIEANEGRNCCKDFLNQAEALAIALKAKCISRKYRKKFSQAYKVLYKEGNLSYLTEILESAQESI